MCTGKCSLCISITLYPIVLLSILCNILLFFPDWDVKYVKEGHITEQVKYMGGFIGGGILMFFSMVFAAVGVAGAVYSFIVALLGFSDGPLCRINNTNWDAPFKNGNLTYVTHHKMWAICIEPQNVVQFNMGLFITLMVASCLQALLCVSQVINGLVGFICGTCNRKEEP